MKEEGKEKGERREETCCLSPILMVSLFYSLFRKLLYVSLF